MIRGIRNAPHWEKQVDIIYNIKSIRFICIFSITKWFSDQKANKIAQIRTFVANHWILATLGLLLLVSLQDPVVVYRLCYMGFFQLFLILFQVKVVLLILYPFIINRIHYPFPGHI